MGLFSTKGAPSGAADLNHARVLVAEDEPFIALDIVSAVEDAGGEAVGPAMSVREALRLATEGDISGAILDVDLMDGDVGPVIESLDASGIPFLIHTGVGLPRSVGDRFKHVAVFLKPTPARLLVSRLAGRLQH